MVKENTFRFKDFEIRQNDSVHKVGTDGVLIGAWTTTDPSDQHILDIGTGTGLIALMLARKSSATIHAIEPDLTAFELAQKNISDSPYSNRIKIHHNLLQEFEPEIKFDRIVSNPPFFQNRLLPPGTNRKMQRHTESLSFPDLVLHVTRLLKNTGSFSVILPAEESNIAAPIFLRNGLFQSAITYVRSGPGKPVIRHLLEFKNMAGEITASHLTLLNGSGERSPEYTALTRLFYL